MASVTNTRHTMTNPNSGDIILKLRLRLKRVRVNKQRLEAAEVGGGLERRRDYRVKTMRECQVMLRFNLRSSGYEWLAW